MESGETASTAETITKEVIPFEKAISQDEAFRKLEEAVSTPTSPIVVRKYVKNIHPKRAVANPTIIDILD